MFMFVSGKQLLISVCDASHHQDAEVGQVVAEADASAGGRLFRNAAAAVIPASVAPWWRSNRLQLWINL